MDRHGYASLRVVFLGTPQTAVPCFEALATAGHEIALTITQPDRPVGRSTVPVASPVKQAALARGIPVVQPLKVRDDAFLSTVRQARSDVLVVVAYGRILPLPVLELVPLGAVNVHFSLLPHYRGAAPVQWALAHGDSQTGVTTMKISEGLDEGDILLQRSVAIAPREHAPALLSRLAGEGATLLLETLDELAAQRIVAHPQNHAEASFAPLLTRADGSWARTWTARDTEGRVRGFDPWPGVWTLRRDRRLRLVKAEALAGRLANAPPGTVLGLESGRALIACAGDTVLAVDEVQPDGRRVLGAAEAFNGRLLAVGDELGSPVARSD